MKIRTKLTLIFLGLGAFVLAVMSISTYYFSSEFRQRDFTQRLKNRAVNITRVLTEVKEVNAALLKRMERNNPASLPNQHIVVYNTSNDELYQSEGDQNIRVDAVLLRRIRKESPISLHTDEFEGIGFVYPDKTDSLIVVATATDIAGHEALINLQTILLVMFCACMLIVFLSGWLYAGKVLQPVSTIVRNVSNISENNLSLRLDEGNNQDELSQLAKTFNNMIARLETSFISQKTFISNASHEIKTPITAMSGQVEVALLQHREKSYYIDLLQNIMNGLRNLNELSTRLLLLAQSTNDQSKETFALLRVDDVIWSATEELLKAHPNYAVDVHFAPDVELHPLLVKGDEQLLKVAYVNLIENGCKYSFDERVRIELSVDPKGFLTTKFTNHGAVIHPDEIPRIFDPFYRARHDHSVNSGFGIGLSLVKSVVVLHGGVISVSSNTTRTEFVVQLPASASF